MSNTLILTYEAETQKLSLNGQPLLTMNEIIVQENCTRTAIYNWVDKEKLLKIEIKGRPFYYFQV